MAEPSINMILFKFGAMAVGVAVQLAMRKDKDDKSDSLCFIVESAAQNTPQAKFREQDRMEVRWSNERSWVAVTCPPHSGLRTSMDVVRRELGERPAATDGLEPISHNGWELEKLLWVRGLHPEGVRALVDPAAVRETLKALFMLTDNEDGAPLVEGLSISDSGRAEVRSRTIHTLDRADAHNMVRLTIDVLAAMRTSIGNLPPQTLEQRSRNVELARRLSTASGRIDGAPLSVLRDVCHRREGDLYVCTGVIDHWLPTLSLIVGRPLSGRPAHEALPRMLTCASDSFSAALTTSDALAAVFAVPMTSLEIRRHQAHASEITFKRLVTREHGAVGQEAQQVREVEEGGEGAALRHEKHIAQAMGDLQRVVDALDILAQRVAWKTMGSILDRETPPPSPPPAAEQRPHSPTVSAPAAARKVPREAADSTLYDVVVAATERWSGQVNKVGVGVQARVTQPLGAGELHAVVTVKPNGTGASVALSAELPHVAGAPLALSPERGLVGWVRSLRELEVGIDPLDRAFLVEGNPARIPEVNAAKVPLLMLADHDLVVTLGETELTLVMPGDLRSVELATVITAALNLWEVVGLQRAGLVEGDHSVDHLH